MANEDPPRLRSGDARRERPDTATDVAGGLGRAAERLAQGTSRRGFLSRLGQTLMLAGGGTVVTAAVRSGDAEAFHFCGHIFTTDSCPHPTGIPRVDSGGFPLRARDGVPVDDLGRRVNDGGSPVDEDGEVLTDPDGGWLPPAPRSRVCDATARRYRQRLVVDGSWFRCCDGHVRKLVDCCTSGSRRINGDRALTGYCFRGRKVFCVMYYQTRIPC